MRVIPVACLKDNYAYLLVADGSKRALVVDPSEAAPVLGALREHGLEIAGILNTHHHWDHVGGNEELVKAFGKIPVRGHVSDDGRIPLLSEGLEHGGGFDAEGMKFRVMHIPGHTLGAIAYIVEGNVFTGDTMFAAGCGRLFEGTPAMMYESLNEKLGSLPDETRVYFGHEYTQANLRFAAHVEPNNAEVKAKTVRVAEARSRGEFTTPSSIGEERRTNPFMRCAEADVIAHVEKKLSADRGPVAVLAQVRAEKDGFR
jgi:hydroxyacylglutathione hydrolase